MIKKLKLFYEVFIIAIGIGLPISQILFFETAFPPFPDHLIFIFVAIASALFYISVRNTIVSFDIVIYFFLLLVFGGRVAAFIAVITVISSWFLGNLKHFIRKDTSKYSVTLKMGLYNAGVYGLIYLIVGLLIYYYPIPLREILAILSIIVLNEIFFSIHTILGQKNFWKYIKEEGIGADFLEMLIYPFGISMALLYNGYGFGATIPLILSILLLSAIGYQMSKYQEKVKKRIHEEEQLNEIVREFEGVLDFDHLIKTTLEKVYSFINAQNVTIFLEDSEQRIYFAKGYDGKNLHNVEYIKSQNTTNSIELPLSTRERVIGSLVVERADTLSKENKILLLNLLKHISLCLANAMLYKISIEDPLTGLHTRRYFEQKLSEGISRVKRGNGRLAIVLFDIDGLKRINDKLGHNIGDQVLSKFAQILKTNFRKTDIVARWGGDEFVVVLPEVTEEKARTYGEKIKKLFSKQSFTTKDREMRSSVTFGCLEYSSSSGIPENEVFHVVDQRLLAMKKTANR